LIESIPSWRRAASVPVSANWVAPGVPWQSRSYDHAFLLSVGHFRVTQHSSSCVTRHSSSYVTQHSSNTRTSRCCKHPNGRNFRSRDHQKPVKPTPKLRRPWSTTYCTTVGLVQRGKPALRPASLNPASTGRIESGTRFQLPAQIQTPLQTFQRLQI